MLLSRPMPMQEGAKHKQPTLGIHHIQKQVYLFVFLIVLVLQYSYYLRVLPLRTLRGSLAKQSKKHEETHL